MPSVSEHGPRPDDSLTSVRGLGKAYVGEAEVFELAEHPLGGCGALLRRELAGVSYGSNRDELARARARACGIKPAMRSRNSMSR